MVAGTLSCKYSAYLISMFEASILNSSTAYSNIIMIGFVKSKKNIAAKHNLYYMDNTTNELTNL